jgi:protein-tyrosine phosphatase
MGQLGVQGTMIGIWLIKNGGFTAREAVGFLRLMRPGSVIGPQQRFLEEVERGAWNGNVLISHPEFFDGAKDADLHWSKAASKALAAQVANAAKKHRSLRNHAKP